MNTAGNGDDAELEAWLRQPLPDLPAAGFAQRVLAALPPPRNRYYNWRGIAFVTFAGLAGTAIAWSKIATASASDLAAHWATSVENLQNGIQHFAGPEPSAALGLAVLVTICSLLVSVYPNRRRRWF